MDDKYHNISHLHTYSANAEYDKRENLQIIKFSFLLFGKFCQELKKECRRRWLLMRDGKKGWKCEKPSFYHMRNTCVRKCGWELFGLCHHLGCQKSRLMVVEWLLGIIWYPLSFVCASLSPNPLKIRMVVRKHFCHVYYLNPIRCMYKGRKCYELPAFRIIW